MDPLTPNALQYSQLQQLLGFGQNLYNTPGAQGQTVGRTYVASSPWEHLSALASKLLGGYEMRQARQGQSDLAQKILGQRQEYSSALDKTYQPVQAPPDSIAAPGFDQASQELQQGQDRASLLRKALLSGDPTIAGYAEKAPQLALEERKLANEGPQLALGGHTPNVYKLLTERKTAEAATQKYGVNPLTGQLYDVHTGKSVSGNGASSLTPEALDQLAELFHSTGQLPPVGRGQSAALTIKSIVNRAAELHPDASLAGNKAGYKADTGSLATQQKILDNAESWERTGKANLRVLLDVSQKLQNTGSPWLNQPVRAFMEKAIGDPNQTAFRAAHATVVNEYAKILSGSQGSSSVTDSARKEAESMLPLDATPEQMIAAAKVLDTDAGNRIGAARQQVGQIKGRISGAPASQGASLAPADRKTLNGKSYEKRADGWYEVPGG